MSPSHIALSALVVFAFAASGCSGAPDSSDSMSNDDSTGTSLGAISPVSSFGSNPGKLKMYEYVPAGLPANAPLVVAMHGCTQQAADYVKAGWNQLADQWKFYVVYPEQTSSNNSNKCFQWFDPSIASRGKGEALSIKQMVDDMKARHSIDDSRVFVTGLSAGAAMTAVMLAAYPEVFSAGAIMSGIPFQCATSTNEAYTCMYGSVSKTPKQWGDLVRGQSNYQGPFPRVSIWNGDADYTVRPVNADELVTQWTNVNGISSTPTLSDTVDGASHSVYNDALGHTIVEKYIIPGMGHGTAVRPGWSPANGCGTAGAYVLSESICSTYYAGSFFGLGSVDPGNNGTGGSAGSGAGGSGGGSAGAGTGGSAGAGTGGSAGTGTAGSAGGGTGGNVGGTCEDINDSNYNHVVAGRAVRCGVGGSYVCALGSKDNLGLWNMMPTWIRKTAPGWYEAGQCP